MYKIVYKDKDNIKREKILKTMISGEAYKEAFFLSLEGCEIIDFISFYTCIDEFNKYKEEMDKVADRIVSLKYLNNCLNIKPEEDRND